MLNAEDVQFIGLKILEGQVLAVQQHSWHVTSPWLRATSQSEAALVPKTQFFGNLVCGLKGLADTVRSHSSIRGLSHRFQIDSRPVLQTRAGRYTDIRISTKCSDVWLFMYLFSLARLLTLHFASHLV